MIIIMMITVMVIMMIITICNYNVLYICICYHQYCSIVVVSIVIIIISSSSIVVIVIPPQPEARPAALPHGPRAGAARK